MENEPRAEKIAVTESMTELESLSVNRDPPAQLVALFVHYEHQPDGARAATFSLAPTRAGATRRIKGEHAGPHGDSSAAA